VPQPQ
jgi:hypothetical protein